MVTMLSIAFIGHQSFFYLKPHLFQSGCSVQTSQTYSDIKHLTCNFAIHLGSIRNTAQDFLLQSAIWTEGISTCSSEQEGCYMPQGAMCHSLPHVMLLFQTRGLDIIYSSGTYLLKTMFSSSSLLYPPSDQLQLWFWNWPQDYGSKSWDTHACPF